MKYYFDTCIWRDYFEDRKDRFRPLGEWALRLINKVIQEKGVFLVSEYVIDELNKEYDARQIDALFADIRKQASVLHITATKSQIAEANYLKNARKLYFNDALHAVLARDEEAILVTRDNHFMLLSDIAEVKKPEELF